MIQQRPGKYFTASEASALLPLIGQMCEDIRQLGQELGRQNHQLQEGLSREPGVDAALELLDRKLQEFSTLGCFFKNWDFESATVEFPARVDGQDVLLCWRTGDPDIRYYYHPGEGYAARHPLPASGTVPE